MGQFQKILPTQAIALTYELFDGVNAPTRFVRSVILKSSDRSVFSNGTIDLTDNGNGDFSDFSQTPNSLGAGLDNYFEVITTVYSNSGFTNVDTDYEVVKEVYYVATDPGGAILGGRRVDDGHDHEHIDEKKLAKALVKAVWESNKTITIAKVINSIGKGFTKEVKKLSTSQKSDSSTTHGLISTAAQGIVKRFSLFEKDHKKLLEDNNKEFLSEIIDKMGSEMVEQKEIFDNISKNVSGLSNDNVELLKGHQEKINKSFELFISGLRGVKEVVDKSHNQPMILLSQSAAKQMGKSMDGKSLEISLELEDALNQLDKLHE